MIIIREEYRLYIVNYHLCQTMSCAIITGKTSSGDRARFLHKWKMGEDNTNILLLSTKVAGVGMNLERASTVLFIDIPYSPQIAWQAIGRVNRRTQSAEQIDVYFLRTYADFSAIQCTINTYLPFV